MGCDIWEECVFEREREVLSDCLPILPRCHALVLPICHTSFLPHMCTHFFSLFVNRHVFFSFLLAQLRRRCPRPSLHPTVSHGEQGRYYEGPAAPRRRGGGRRQRERRRRRRSGRERTAVPIRRGDAAADAAAAVAGGRVGGTPTNALWELVHLAHRADRQTFARTHVH